MSSTCVVLCQDAIERHADPMFMKNRLSESPEAAGRNFISFICCNYWLVKTFAEPFLNTSKGVQNIVYGSAECIQYSRSRLNCGEIANSEVEEGFADNSRYEDERKGRNAPFAVTSASCCAKTLYYVAVFGAYFLILMVIYAVFTI